MTKWVCTRTGDSLQHHGIKGMKWGRRRYQNADGSLTPAGKKRYGYVESDYDYGKDIVDGVKVKRTSKGSSDEEKAQKHEEEIARYNKALKSTKNAEKAVDAMRNFNDDVKAIKNPAVEKRIRKSLDGVSDKELQQMVQRMNMEDNYTRMMMNRERLNSGEDFVSKFLDISSTFIKGATTTLTIAVLVKELMGK